MGDQDSHLTSDELIAYADAPDRLRPARRAAIEAHLQQCDVCRQRLVTSDDVSNLLRTHLPAPEPDPERITAIMDAIDRQPAEAQPDTSRRQKSFRRRTWSLTMMSVIVLIILGIGTTVTTVGYSWSVSPLSRVVKVFDEDDHSPTVPDNRIPTVTAISSTSSDDADPLDSLAFEPVVLSELPGDFRLIDQNAEGDNRIAIHYVNDNDLRLKLIESVVGKFENAVPLDRYQLHVVSGVEVFMLQETSFESIGHLVWEHEGVVFDLLVLDFSASRNVTTETAESIARVIIEATDR